MSFLNETFNKAIRDLIQAANPAVLAIRARQNAPLPDVKPFATVQINFRPPAGWAEVTHSNNISGEDIDEKICQRTRIRASVNYFKVDGSYPTPTLSAIDAAVDFTNYMQGSAAREFMCTAGIGLNRISEPRNVTALENDKWEERAQIDVDFNVISSRTDLIYEIKSVLISGEYQEHSNEYPLSFTVDENSGAN